MLVRTVVATAFGTNCHVVAAGRGEQCVIVDPGIGVLDELDEVLAAEDLHPAAVLLTHGHLDHCFSVAPVCGAREITAYVHPGDREMLADPAKGLSMSLTELFGGRMPYSEPERVEPLPDGGTITVAGIEFTVDHAPGHTRGSVLFRLPDESQELLLSGDVLFAGSIGRTDLPGGSLPQMMTSLRDKILTLDDDIVVLPGHGPATTIGRERRSNPYLLEVAEGTGQMRGW